MSDAQLRHRLEQIRDTAATPYELQSAQALLTTLDWHMPWVFYRQVFAPTYIGDVLIGVGCRACGPREGVKGPCAPLRSVFDAFHIEPDERDEWQTLTTNGPREHVIDMKDIPRKYLGQLFEHPQQ